MHIKKCIEDKSYRNDIYKTLFVLYLIVPIGFFGYSFIKKVESPLTVEFDDSFSFGENTINIVDYFTNRSYNITINDDCESFEVSKIDIVFTNYIFDYSKDELINATINGETDNILLKNTIKYGKYLVRSFPFDEINDVNDIKNTDIQFKLPKNYRFLYLSISLIIGNNTVKFYSFTSSLDTFIIENFKYIFSVNELVINNDSLYNYNVNCSIITQRLNVFELYKMDYR